MLDFRESNRGGHALQRLPHDGLGSAGLASVVQPQHQQEDLLVLPHATHLPSLEARQAVSSHASHLDVCWSVYISGTKYLVRLASLGNH